MLLVLASWLILLWVFIGIGLILFASYRQRITCLGDILLAFWPGWAATLAFLQLSHFVFRVGEWTLLVVIATALFGWATSIRKVWTIVTTKAPIALFAGFLLFIAVGLWLADKAMGPGISADTPRYHMQAVLWNMQYPIVPGLGNLHDRFGFNSSFFLYAALISLGPLKHLGCYLASGLLAYALLGQMLISIYKLATFKKDISHHLFGGLLLPPLMIWILGPDMLGVPFMVGYAPELPIFAIGIVLSWEVFNILQHNDDQNEVGYRFVFITLLAAAGITIKLSMIAMSMCAWLLAFIIWIRCTRRGGRILIKSKPLIASIVVWMALVVPWMARGVILSGYIAYPSAIGAFPVEWKMRRQDVLNEANWVKGWARTPDTKHWVQVLDNNRWFDGWVDRLPREITKAFWIGFLGLLIGAVLLDFYGGPNANAKWLFPLVPISSIGFWFLSAPDPRFAGSSFWVFAAGSICLVFDQITHLVHFKRFARLLAFSGWFAFFVYVAPLHSSTLATHGKWASTTPRPEWLNKITKEYQVRKTFSGLKINVPPPWTDCCSDAPLPCTPYFNPYLTLIKPGNPRRGFRISPGAPLPTVQGIRSPAELGVEGLIGRYDYDLQSGMRWMKSPSWMAVYTEIDDMLRLTMTPRSISNGKAFGEKGNLTIFINGRLLGTWVITSHESFQADMPIKSGYNILRLELGAPNLLPSQIDPKSTDKREMAIAFEFIEIGLPFPKANRDRGTSGYATPFFEPTEFDAARGGSSGSEDHVTRSEIAQQIIKTKYGEHFDFPDKQYFSDVPPNHPQFRYIQRFRYEGITAIPTGEGSWFGADDPVTRYMLATFLVRARYGETFNIKDDDRFEDLPRSHANYRYVLKAADDGILKACGLNKFCPDDYPSKIASEEAISKYLGPDRIKK